MSGSIVGATARQIGGEAAPILEMRRISKSFAAVHAVKDVDLTVVPGETVGIAGRQTGIYPRESPGGWHLLGRTPLRIADPDEGYFPIRAGDRIQLVAISLAEFEARRDERL